MKYKIHKGLLRLTGYLWCCFIIQMIFYSSLFANGRDAKSVKSVREVVVTVEFQNDNFIAALNKIENMTAYRFSYNIDDLRSLKPVNGTFSKVTLYDVLYNLSQQAEVKFRQIDENISITKINKSKLQKEVPVEIVQTRTVSGRVIDQEDGQPLPGVNVLERNTTNGTITDLDGRYSLLVASDAVLVFSMVGYTREEIELGTRSIIDLAMLPDVQQLQEIVVVGYGIQEKASVVGSIVQVASETLQKAGGVSNLAQALTGHLPGVSTIQQTHEPGADDPRIVIRGVGSWNSRDPLILVDGIERRMNDIDINEVESIAVLKDASATAVFGVKGAEGVILITTKRGKLGKPVITVDANLSTKTLSEMTKKLNSYDQFKFRNEVIEYQLNYGASGASTNWETYMPEEILKNYKQPQAAGMQYIFPDVDWKKEVTKPFPLSSRVNFNVSGGTQFAKYFGSMSYSFDDDIIKTGIDPMNAGYKSKIGYTRVNFRTNLDLNLTNSTIFSTNIAGWVGNKTQGGGSPDQIYKAYNDISPHLFPAYHADGSYGFNPIFSGTNPLLVANNRGRHEIRRTNVTTDFSLTQKLDFITKGLSTRGTVSYDVNFFTEGGIQDGGGSARTLYIDPSIIDIKEGERPEDYMIGYIHFQSGNHDYDWVKGTPTYLAEGSGGGNTARRLFYQAQINYARSFNLHSVTGLGLMNREEYAAGSMFPKYREDWVGRITYGYDHRYLFESNFAYNGSEKFAPGKRFGFFPSVAMGWVLSNERFLKNVGWLENLKVRYSIGKVGSDAFDAPRWSYRTSWVYDKDNTNFGYPQLIMSPYDQHYEGVTGNPDLTWETSLKQNLGFEVGVFRNRLLMSLDLFRDNRTGVFMTGSQRTQPPYAGFKPVSANIGETEVKGYEVEFTYRNTIRNQINYFITFNHTDARDLVIYKEDPALLPAYLKEEGFRIGQARAIIPVGFVNNWDEVYSRTAHTTNNGRSLPGDYRLLDFNASGLLDNNSQAPFSWARDRPQNTYNWTLGGDFKGFNIMVQFYGMYNVRRTYTAYIAVPFYGTTGIGPVLQHHTDIWTPDNPNGKFKHARLDFQGNPGYGPVQNGDGSLLRLKTAEIGYTVKSGIINRIGASSMKVYMNGHNLLIWTRMFEDREGNDAVTSMYPMTRRFNLGTTIKF